MSGHADFVKCLLTTTLSGTPVLLSGAADSTIILWNLKTGKTLHKLKGHAKAVQYLAIDPLSLPSAPSVPIKEIVLFSASSDREIRRWHVSLDRAFELPESQRSPILSHDTSIYTLKFDADGDLWTASADKTAKHLVRGRNWEADTVLSHPDFVRDVVVAEDLGLVVTACRDEEVRVWDLSTGELQVTYTGHYEEVTGLVRVGRKTVVSVSIDGTIRQWSLEKADMQRFKKERELEASGQDRSVESSRQKGRPGLTAEEEAELAELMDDDDD